MPAHENTHFDKYTPQNAAKHAILSRYLQQYLYALKNQVRWFHYIDGFAGRGTYGAGKPGSPLLVLNKIREVGLASRATLSLVEERRDYANELRSIIDANPATTELRWPPFLECGSFTQYFDRILGRDIYKAGGKVATFAFIDPCGVDGMRLEDIGEILDQSFGEVLLFFNFDGLNRVLGAQSAGKLDSSAPRLLFGSAARVQSLLEQLKTIISPAEREAAIRDALIAAIRSGTKAKFFVPFRFEASVSDRTSHYLVHCSSHPLAFKFMKGVMSAVGRDNTDSYGRLEFLTDRERGVQFALFRPEVELQKQKILDRLAQSPCKVYLFTNQWVSDPTDPFSERDYRQMLLSLEFAGKLSVFDKHNVNPAPAATRPKGTLADGYWLQLSTALF